MSIIIPPESLRCLSSTTAVSTAHKEEQTMNKGVMKCDTLGGVQ